VNGDPETFRRLLAQVGTRDVSAFRRLYDLASPRLLLVARVILQDPALAEDALQDCFVKIWERAGQYDPARGAALAWMAGICRNAAIDELRRGRGGQQAGALAEQADETGPPPVERMRLARCLSTLPPDQASVLVSIYHHGLTHTELAKTLNLPLGTVKSRVRRALSTMRERMG
jgi:RNA polymerase sigma-70 factor (ECF subfamily)